MSYTRLLILLILSLIICTSLALLLGETALWHVLEEMPAIGWLILQQVRLPRVILAILVGMTLGLAGAVLQGLLRNPLADPGLIGVAGGASLGAVLVFYFGISQYFTFILPLGGIMGALLTLMALYLLAGRNPQMLTLILAGIALNTFTAALTALALNLAPSPYAATEIVFWLLGSLANRSFDHVWIALPFMLLGWLFLFSTARALDALTLGEDMTRSLGFNLSRVKMYSIVGTALSVGAAVAVVGNIGFVGLVVPHLLRPLVNHQPSHLLIVSTLGGAILMVLADMVVRLLPTQAGELKLGVITALVGAPFFLYLILKNRIK